MRVVAALSVVLLVGCASAKPKVNLDEPQTVLGKEADVRVSATFSTNRIAPNQGVSVTYQVENLRTTPIAVAELVAETEFDSDSRTLTVNVGSEVPGNEFLPRLIRIDSGETKSFTTNARMKGYMTVEGSSVPLPQYLRLSVHFLSEVEPFKSLVGISEHAVHDPKLADDLFTKWVETTQTVETNAMPIRWSAVGGIDDATSTDPALRTPRVKRRVP